MITLLVVDQNGTEEVLGTTAKHEKLDAILEHAENIYQAHPWRCVMSAVRVLVDEEIVFEMEY